MAQRRPCQPRPTQGDVGDRELLYGGARRPRRALREVLAQAPASPSPSAACPPLARLLPGRRPSARRPGRRAMTAHVELAPSLVERIKQTMVGLKMPRAIEILDATVRLPRLPVPPAQRAELTTPADRAGACVDCFPVRTAFPVIQAGRHPHLHFRGLLSFTRVTARWIAQPPKGGLCHEASTQSVTQPSRSSATRSIDNSLDGTFLHW